MIQLIVMAINLLSSRYHLVDTIYRNSIKKIKKTFGSLLKEDKQALIRVVTLVLYHHYLRIISELYHLVLAF